MLNDFSVDVGPTMDAKIAQPCKNFYIPSVMKSFAYEPITNEEICLKLSQLDPCKASGPENIPTKFLKVLSPIISPLLAYIFNKCYDVGKFPEVLKQAKVITIYKSGPKNVASNYRPKSLLSPISKVFEILLFVRLEKFFSLQNVITKQQFGFRKGYSTEMAIFNLTNKLRQHKDEGYFTCYIFLDLSKAFDTVNLSILLKKIQACGIRGNMYNLLSSYLSNRCQFAQCNHVHSNSKLIKCGVPQGSTLGPLLFLLYVNDLPIHTKLYVDNLFTDDTVLLLKNKNVQELHEQSNEALKGIDEWMKYNGLSVNYSKTTYFVSHPKRKMSPLAQFELKIGEHALLKKNNTKYLGVIIDQDLKWQVHIENVIKKLAGAARISCKIGHYVDKKTLVNLYYAFAYPHLKYGILAWGNTNRNLLQKVKIIQNKILRIISFKCLKNHVNMSELYKPKNILQTNDTFKLEMAKFMHSHFHQNLPENFANYFCSASNHDNYATRSITNENYYITRANTQCGQSGCALIEVKIWNNISADLKRMSKFTFSKQ